MRPAVYQAGKLFGNELFGADGFGYAEYGKAAVFVVFELGAEVFEVFAGTDARDAAGDVEQVGGNFAGDDVGFVAAGEREQQVGIFRAGAF